VTNLFKPFSPANTFAMFNDNTIDLSSSCQRSHDGAGAGRDAGFGAVFLNVEVPTRPASSIRRQHEPGKFFVPVGTGAAGFLGELFSSPLITRVTLTLGGCPFSFDGSHFSAGRSGRPGQRAQLW